MYRGCDGHPLEELYRCLYEQMESNLRINEVQYQRIHMLMTLELCADCNRNKHHPCQSAVGVDSRRACYRRDINRCRGSKSPQICEI